MAVTRNGWVVGPAATTAIRGPRTKDTGDVLAGDVAAIFQHFVNQYDARIEPVRIINGYRNPTFNRRVGGDARSNHISATALDLNGDVHPYEANLPRLKRGLAYRSGFSSAQVKAVRALLAEYDGVIFWGLDFNRGYRDSMHFEIRGTAAQVGAVVSRVNRPAGRRAGQSVRKGDTGAGVVEVQTILARLGFYRGKLDGHAGDETDRAIRAFQFAAGLEVDGSFGNASRDAAAKVPAFPGVSLPSPVRSAVTRAYQQRLKDRRWAIDADGFHGRGTSSTFRKFQAEKGLDVDGCGGAQTWTALWVRPL